MCACMMEAWARQMPCCNSVAALQQALHDAGVQLWA